MSQCTCSACVSITSFSSHSRSRRCSRSAASDPFAISLDNEGNLLIGDVGNVRLTKIAFGANNGTEYNWNGGGTVDGVSASGGKIYFSDMAKSRLVRIDDLSGTNPMIFGSKGTGTNQLDRPQGIFVK